MGMGRGPLGEEPEGTEVAADALEDDELAATFFSTVPPAPDAPVEGWQPSPMEPLQRRAMFATIGMVGLCCASLLAFTALADVAIVQPVVVGDAQMTPVGELRFGEALVAARAAATHAAVQPAPPPPPSVQTASVSATQPEPVEAAAALEPGASVAPTAPDESAAPVEPAAPAPAGAPEPREASAPAALATHSSQGRVLPARRAVESDEAKSAPARTSTKARPRSRAKPAAPGDSEAVVLRKRAYRELNRGDARRAQGLAQRALMLDPSDPGTYIVLGGARDSLGDREGARSAFRQCVARATGPLVSGCRNLAR